MKCKIKGCEEEARAMLLPDGNGEVEWLCFEHATKAGYCWSCGTFCAGIESYDFSEIQGYCSQCVDEIKSEVSD